MLRCLNRMNDLVPGAKVHGKIRLHGTDIYDPTVDVIQLRDKRLGDDELIAIDMDGQQDVLFCGPGDRDRAIAVRNEDIVDVSCEVVIYVN